MKKLKIIGDKMLKILKFLTVVTIIILASSSFINCSNTSLPYKYKEDTVATTTPSEIKNEPEKPSYDPSTPPVKENGSFRDFIVTLKKPVLVDFGSTNCVPCKMMEPILEDLKMNYTDQLETFFVNVSQDNQKTSEFGITVIPTQVFFDASGKELHRHIGFFSKEEILETFKSYNISIK